MKYIFTFEKFEDKTIKSNNDEYSSYYNDYKSTVNSDVNARSKAVAWIDNNSQEKNFKLVSKYINNNDSIMDYGCGIGDFISYLNKEEIVTSKYLGVDINSDFIETAKESYPNDQFQLISNVNDINIHMDTICVIGVFTWYISKEDFIKCIHKLYELCNKQILITCLHRNGNDPKLWKRKYRYYNEDVFNEIFPNYNMEFDYAKSTMLVRIIK